MNSKGITPIIAIVLLLMITVAITGAVSVWLTSVQQRSQSSIDESASQITSSTQQAIGISFLKCQTNGVDTSNITVVIRNSGTRRIEEGNIELIIGDKEGKIDLAHGTQISPWTNLDVDESTNPPVTWDTQDNLVMAPTLLFTPDEIYQISITVPGGAKTQKACTATS